MNTELAWAAGFFDGEGNTCFCGTLQISIGQVNRSNLERFQRAVDAGSINGPYDKGRKPIWNYSAYSDSAFAVWRAISSMLGAEKNDQFLRHAIRYCFRTARHRAGNPRCRRGHAIAEFGRYRGDCAECRRLRRSGLDMPSILPAPTAFDLRLHGIREYVPQPWSFGKKEEEYEPCLET